MPVCEGSEQQAAAACHRSVRGAMADEAVLAAVGLFHLLHCLREALSSDLLARHHSLDALVHSGDIPQFVEAVTFAIDASFMDID